MILDRRKFLKTGAAVGRCRGVWRLGRDLAGSKLAADAAPGSFDFVFFTDTHIQPELDATHGCDMCFRKIAGPQARFRDHGRRPRLRRAERRSRARQYGLRSLQENRADAADAAAPHDRKSRRLRRQHQERRVTQRSELRKENVRRPHRPTPTTPSITRAGTSSSSIPSSRPKIVCGRRGSMTSSWLAEGRSRHRVGATTPVIVTVPRATGDRLCHVRGEICHLPGRNTTRLR